MNEQQQRIAIAESLGWERVGLNGWMKGTIWNTIHILPDYLNDLNACHEFEKTLTETERGKYEQFLSKVIFENSKYHAINLDWEMIHAKAQYKCEVYLRTKGLWQGEGV